MTLLAVFSFLSLRACIASVREAGQEKPARGGRLAVSAAQRNDPNEPARRAKQGQRVDVVFTFIKKIKKTKNNRHKSWREEYRRAASGNKSKAEAHA
jgi:hypothetical protein